MKTLRLKLRFMMILIIGTAAFAAETAPQTHEAKDAKKDIPEAPSPMMVTDGACLSDPAVLEDIQAQKDKIAQDRKDLEARETELKAREQALQDELKKLTAIRDDIEKTNALHKKENEGKVAKLIEILEGMSPKSAAKMLAELDESLAVEAVNRMSTQKISKIMNLIEPQKSSRLSELLAGVARSRMLANNGKATETNVKGGDKNGTNQQNNQSNREPVGKKQ